MKYGKKHRATQLSILAIVLIIRRLVGVAVAVAVRWGVGVSEDCES